MSRCRTVQHQQLQIDALIHSVGELRKEFNDFQKRSGSVSSVGSTGAFSWSGQFAPQWVVKVDTVEKGIATRDAGGVWVQDCFSRQSVAIWAEACNFRPGR
eukprot:5163193-Amphidinium_carterae.2